MNRKTFITRHSITDWNTNHIYQGWSNNPISELGIKQAHELKERLKNEGLKTIFSSPLLRTKQTAEIISDNRFKICFVDELKDRRSSPEFEGKSEAELFKITQDFARSINDLDFKIEGGESIREVYERTVTWFNQVKKEKISNFLIVTHEINIQSLIFHQLDLKLNLENALAFKEHLRIRHDRLTIIEEDREVGFYLSINSL